jgi:hypothetical protein
MISLQAPASQPALGCEIVAGHDSSHMAFATTDGGGELWWLLCWNGQTREISQVHPCDGHCPSDQYVDDCLLPDGHLGPHGFQFA